jgi:hypothetical protein
MSIEHIVTLLIEEHDRLEAAIAALQGPPSAPAGIYEPDWVKPKTKAEPKRKGLNAATRRKMAEGQKRRWAAINAAKAAPVVQKKAPSKKAALLETVTPSAADAEFKAKMSIAMKKAWAKRKKAAKK